MWRARQRAEWKVVLSDRTPSIRRPSCKYSELPVLILRCSGRREVLEHIPMFHLLAILQPVQVKERCRPAVVDAFAHDEHEVSLTEDLVDLLDPEGRRSARRRHAAFDVARGAVVLVEVFHVPIHRDSVSMSPEYDGVEVGLDELLVGSCLLEVLHGDGAVKLCSAAFGVGHLSCALFQCSTTLSAWNR